MALHAQKVIKKSGEIGKRPGSRARSAYVYAVVVDGIVRYIGKGRNGRMYSHLIEAKRSAGRCSPDTSGLYPRMHRKLVEAVRAGSQISERAIVSGLNEGDVIALVDPDLALRKTKPSSGPVTGAASQ